MAIDLEGFTDKAVDERFIEYLKASKGRTFFWDHNSVFHTLQGLVPVSWFSHREPDSHKCAEFGTELSDFFSAWDELLDEGYVIKFPKSKFMAHADSMGQFYQEIRIHRSLRHQNIIRAFGFAYFRNRICLLMEYQQGNTLHEHIKSDGPLPPEDALSYLWEVSDALSYIHQNGVIHRDIKPTNILIADATARKRKIMELPGNGEGDDKTLNLFPMRPQKLPLVLRPMVLDFGLAFVEKEGDTINPESFGVGTPNYMAPEQFNSTLIDRRADLYALGCTLYAAIAGRTPFYDRDSRNIRLMHLHERPTNPSQFNQLIPEEFQQPIDFICLKSLEKKPEKRYQSAKEMGDDILAVLMELKAYKQNCHGERARLIECYRQKYSRRVRALRRDNGSFLGKVLSGYVTNR
ncbi:serine/threonine protein kinase [Candidatus Woesearchaeota archaeon]|nr:serine/threonine protein kinase [Candidatus Woesearchaeota archaeon]